MPTLSLPDLDLEYDVRGPRGDSRGRVVLIHGLGCQLIQWPESILDALTGAGYQVLRFDNRDVGLSRLKNPSRPKRASPVDLLQWRLGKPLPAAYSLRDMVGDTVALLDHLDWPCAHIVGVSMGGMIAQQMAIDHPQRVRTLTSIMSTSGARSVGHPKATVAKALLTPPKAKDRDSLVEHIAGQWKLQQGRKHPSTDEDIRNSVVACLDRGMNGAGFLRQVQAILNAPNREPHLAKLKLPTLVIHGDDDPLVHCSGGKAVARAVPGARLELIEGWGHDWPPSVQPLLSRLLLEHFSVAAV